MFAQDGPQFDILAMATTAMWTKNPKKEISANITTIGSVDVQNGCLLLCTR